MGVRIYFGMEWNMDVDRGRVLELDPRLLFFSPSLFFIGDLHTGNFPFCPFSLSLSP